MTKYCPNCYVGIDPADKVCANCGAELKPAETKMAEAFPAEDPGDAAEVFAAKIQDTSCGAPEEGPAESPDDAAPAQEDPEDAADAVIAAMIDNDSCGEDHGPDTEELPPPVPETYQNAFVNEPESPARAEAEGPAPKIMGLGEWVLTLFLVCIPLVNLIMLIYWSAAGDIDPNKKNFARAELIIMAIGVVLSFMFFGSFIAMILAYTNYYY